MNESNYEKIRHLVEIKDDIFSVFTINAIGEAADLSIGKNIDVENSSLIENIFTNFKNILCQSDEANIIPHSRGSSDLLGKLKWKIVEYEKLRILQIADQNKIVVVLIKSNTSLHETIDNILGYYYEQEQEDDIPKSLFE